MKRQFILFILPWLLATALPHAGLVPALKAQGKFHSWAELYLSPGSHLLVFQNVDASNMIANNGQLSLTQDWHNTSGFTMPGTGKINLSGSIPQRITAWNATLPSININNSAGILLDSSSLSIRDSLVFETGNLTLGEHDLVMQDGAPILNANRDQFVVTNGAGRLSQTVNGAVQFPIGWEPGSYTPCTLDNGTLSGEVACRVFEHVSLPLFSMVEERDFPVDRTWIIETQTGLLHANVDLFWGDAEMLSGLDDNAWGVASVGSGSTALQSATRVTKDPNGLFHTRYTGLQSSDSLVVIRLPATVHQVDPFHSMDVSLFPNPSRGKLWVDLSGPSLGSYQGTLTNATGQMVYKFELEKEAYKSQIELDLSMLARGLFLLSLQGKSSSATPASKSIYKKLLLY